VAAAFVGPLAVTLFTAAQDTEVQTALPRTAVLLRAWDGIGLPDDGVYPVLGEELAAAESNQAIGALIRRLNFETPGLRSLLLRTARAGRTGRGAMTALDARWADPAIWRLLRRATGPWTDLYLLRALDLTRADDGRIVAVESDQALFRAVLGRTFGIAALATALTLLLAYPVAATLARTKGAMGRVGVALVLMPFWISILVRATAWFILLQREGPINALLLALGLVQQPAQLMFTRFAVVLAIVHVTLPFAILPLFAVMRRMDRGLLQAARGLGAASWQVFLRVHLPLAMPGVLAAGGIVFLISVGFYVTPVLVGGPGDQMAGAFIESYINQTLNWGMAAALAVLLLLGTAGLLLLVWVPLRLVAPK
jgi:putative spermidine/putrescine transport system permease protein